MALFSTWTTWKSSLKDSIYNSKKFKKFPKSQARLHLTGSDQIRERERAHAAWGSHGPGHAAWVVRPRPLGSHDLGLTRLGSHGLGLEWPKPRGSGRQACVAWGSPRPGWVWFFLASFLRLRLHLFFFFFFSFWLWFLFCWCCCFVIYGLINRVSKTWFSSGRHMKNDATSDVIRPWKLSLKNSIYRSKLSLRDSSC